MRRRASGDRGTGAIASLAGVTAFLVFVLFVVQLTFNLYATSAVTAAGYDAARLVAGAARDGDVAAAQRTAEAHARAVLGRYADRVEFVWTTTADEVTLGLRATQARFLPRTIGGLVGFDTIDRTVRVRVEDLR